MLRFRTLVLMSIFVCPVLAQDAREIVRKSVELDQADWASHERLHVDRAGNRSRSGFGRPRQISKADQWETVVLYGEPHRRMLERDGKPLSAEDQRKEQVKLDKAVAKLEHESPEQRARREAEYEKEREKDREFLRDVPDIFDFALLGDQKIDGHDVWVISATPSPALIPSTATPSRCSRSRAKMWIDKAEYQWVRLEAETTATISYRAVHRALESGRQAGVRADARERRSVAAQARSLSGAGRLGLVKKVAAEQELTWNNYRKFQVDSKIVATQ